MHITLYKMGFSGTGDAGEVGLTPGLGRPPGIGRGNPLHYSCLEKSMDREACQKILSGKNN